MERVSRRLQEGEKTDSINISEYNYIKAIKPFTKAYSTNNDYKVVSIDNDNTLYAIEYTVETPNHDYLYMNIGMAAMVVITGIVLVYVDKKVLKPFHNMSDLSLELAKGNLSTPIKEEKNKFFGKFLWGMDMLRDNLETNRKKELELQKEKKTLILSISHDIKTPLSAIKLYTKAFNRKSI